MTRNPALLEDVKGNFRESNIISGKDKAMLAYAAAVACGPPAVVQADVERLREHGFNDRGILEINLTISYMSFVNRIAEGLGVELEDSLKTFQR